MGGSRWDTGSYAAYDDRVRVRAATIGDTTAHTADVHHGRASGVHQLLNPFGVRLRESRDSAANPESVAIAVFFDVTGSMGTIPVTLQRKLKTLMRTLIDRHYVRDPHVLFAAVGDATIDAAPLQVGQFEANIQMDDDMDRMYLEGGGGGNVTESYELAYYWAARHTAIDCWEKRQKKGYLFTIGDEMPYPQVEPRLVSRLTGSPLQAPLMTADAIAEASTKYHCFHILADTSTSQRHPEVEATWRGLLGDRVLKMADPQSVAELIALTIGLGEGVADAVTATVHLREMGVDEAAIAAIAAAITPFARAIVVRA